MVALLKRVYFIYHQTEFKAKTTNIYQLNMGQQKYQGRVARLIKVPLIHARPIQTQDQLFGI